MASSFAQPHLPVRRRSTVRSTSRLALGRAGGFTIVELLVVIAIIIALLGTLLAALALASRRAQSTQTQVFLTSISNALVQFERDVGYMPPLLGDPTAPTVDTARDYFGQPTWALDAGGQPTPVSVSDFQRWRSVTSLPEYLLGYGDRTQDGNGVFDVSNAPSGSPGAREPILGIRHPSDDGCWGCLLNPRNGQPLGSLKARNTIDVTGAYNPANANGAAIQGKVFGPYLQVSDNTNLGGIKSFDGNGDPVIVLPGDDANFEQLPKVFIDYWGSPIEYYRRPYNVPDLKTREAWASDVLGRDLGDIFALRPAEFKPGEDRNGVADAANDDGTTARLKASSFALLSRGADKALDRTTRRDVNGFNRDNLVEVGQ